MRQIFLSPVLWFTLSMTHNTFAQTDEAVPPPTSPAPVEQPAAPPEVKEESMPFDTTEVKPVEAAVSQIEDVYKEERQKLLSQLTDVVEPSLIKGDIQRLNRNVMRLGSYRRDWVQSSQDFLVANAALAELYIYRYVLLGNQRLNRAGLAALNRFSTLREPRAVLLFMNFFVDDAQQAVLAMDLLTKAVEQDSHLAAEAVEFLNGSVGKKIRLDLKIQFGEKACSKLHSSSLVHKEMLMAWKAQAQNFWENVLADELDTCLKGV